MKTFELRVYKLASKEAASAYGEIWKKHLGSLRKFEIETHAVFLDVQNGTSVLALVSYAPGADVGVVTQAYMSSEEFRSDMAGFDFKNIVSVTSTPISAMEASPLR